MTLENAGQSFSLEDHSDGELMEKWVAVDFILRFTSASVDR